MTVYVAFNECEGPDSSTNLIANTICSVSGVATHGFRFDDVPDGSPTSVDITLPTALTEGWAHVRIALGDGAGARQSGDIFTIKDTSGGTIARLNRQGVGAIGGPATLRGAILGNSLTNFAVDDDGPHNVDIHWRLSDTTGFVKIYLEGVLVLTQEGDVLATSGITQVDTITLGEPSTVTTATNANTDGENISWGQILISDQNTIGAKVYTLYPTQGSVNEWDSGTYTFIDERGVNDSDLVATTTDTDEITVDTSVTLTDPTAPRAFTGVVQTFRASYDAGSAVTQVTPLLNDTTATSTSFGTTQALTTSLANYSYVWDDDPSDSSEWNASKINDYEFGLRADT